MTVPQKKNFCARASAYLTQLLCLSAADSTKSTDQCREIPEGSELDILTRLNIFYANTGCLEQVIRAIHDRIFGDFLCAQCFAVTKLLIAKRAPLNGSRAIELLLSKLAFSIQQRMSELCLL